VRARTPVAVAVLFLLIAGALVIHWIARKPAIGRDAAGLTDPAAALRGPDRARKEPVKPGERPADAGTARAAVRSSASDDAPEPGDAGAADALRSAVGADGGEAETLLFAMGQGSGRRTPAASSRARANGRSSLRPGAPPSPGAPDPAKPGGPGPAPPNDDAGAPPRPGDPGSPKAGGGDGTPRPGDSGSGGAPAPGSRPPAPEDPGPPVPGNEAPIPDDPSSIPEEPLPIPEDPLPIPEDPLPIPEEPLPIPEDPLSIPEDPSSIPEDPSSIPEEMLPLEELLPAIDELPPGLGQIVGIVLDRLGTPVAGATIAFSTQSGLDGRFFLLVPPGRHDIYVSAPGYADRSVRVEVGAGESLEVEVALDFGATVAGRVLDPAGFPAPGAQVRVAWSEEGALALDDGTYEVRGLAPGVDVYLVAEDLAGGVYGPSRPRRVKPTATGIDLELTAASAITGGVLDDATGEPVASALVSVTPVGGSDAFIARALALASPVTTDLSGRFEIGALAAGTYVVRAQVQGRAPGEVHATVGVGETATVVIPIEPPAVVVGRVVSALDGAPVAGAVVVRIPPSDPV
jgi:hypothetical protein